MDNNCIFKFLYDCSATEKLQISKSDGQRLSNILDASRSHGEVVCSSIQAILSDTSSQVAYHKACVSKFLITAKRSENKKRTATASTTLPEKRTRTSAGHPFDWLQQCFYCCGPCDISPDPKNPQRWVPSYLVRETESKKTEEGNLVDLVDAIEIRIRNKCHERADEWSGEILERLAALTVRAGDLHAADARYHRNCYVRFFSGRSLPGDSKDKSATESPDALQSLAKELQDQRSLKWDSVQLMERFVQLGGHQMKRSKLINLLCHKIDELVVLSAPGYRSLLFSNNSDATLKMIKDEDEDDNLKAAMKIVAKHIRRECSEIEYHRHTYNTKILKPIAEEHVPSTLQQLLGMLSLGEQSLPTLLIGNMVTSSIKKHPTPLQIAIGVFLRRKKLIMQMHDYLVSCSYDELLRFKRSSAVAKYNQMCSTRQQPISVEGLVQVIVDNFDAELSSPNGLLSTHEMAIIEMHSTVLEHQVTDTIPRISKSEMSNPICFDEEDEIIPYSATEKPLPPHMPAVDPPEEYTLRFNVSPMRELVTWTSHSSKYVLLVDMLIITAILYHHNLVVYGTL